MAVQPHEPQRDATAGTFSARSAAARVFVPIQLAERRFRRNPLLYAGIALAVAAAALLIGWTSIAVAEAQEDVVQFRLQELPFDERAVQVVYHVPVGEPDTNSRRVAVYFRALARVLEPVRRIRVWHQVGPSRLFVAEAPTRDVLVEQGRLPRRCTSSPCEVLSLAGHAVGDELELSPQLTVRVVGRGSFTSLALPSESEFLPATPDVTESAVLADSLSGPLRAAARSTGRSVSATASLAPERVHGSPLRPLSSYLRAGAVRLSRGEPLVQVTPPLDVLEALADRGDVARSRLLLVAGQGALLVIAFAAFAASARRDEAERLADQLTLLAASRRQLLLFRAVEVGVPSLVGLLVAVGGLFLIVWIATGREDLPDGFLRAALPYKTLAAIIVVTAAAALILGFSLGRRRHSRFGIGMLDVAALCALGLILWQAVAGGGLTATDLADGEGTGPLLFLLPGLIFFSSAIVLLRGVPVLLRLGERAARRGPFALRLGLLSAIRRPREIAAATTFLALSLGACIFALNYRATLTSHSLEEADFRAGVEWRVLEARAETAGEPARGRKAPSPGDTVPPTVAEAPPLTAEGDATPFTRFRLASSETPEPVIRFAGTVRALGSSGAEREIEVLGLNAERVDELSGWQDGYSPLDRAAIAHRLGSGPVGLAGPRVAGDATAIRVTVRGRQTVLDRFAVLHFLRRADQEFVQLPLGAVLARRRMLARSISGRLRGAELVGIEFPPSSVPFSFPDDNGTIEFGEFEQRRGGSWVPLGPLVDWTAAQPGIFTIARSGQLEYADGGRLLEFHLQSTTIPLVRPRVPEAVSVIASPQLAQRAEDGLVNVSVAGQEIVFRVVGTASFFPTVVRHPNDFLVADYEMLFAAMNATFPGVAGPTEAWFFRPQPETFSEALARAPFRVESVVGREPLRERFSSDPLAAGASQVFGLTAVAAALMALIGLLLATRASLTAERSVSAEYEALGVPPRTLARSSQLRLTAVSLTGLLAGFLGGLLAIYLVGSFVAVTGSAEAPLPPIRPAVSWLAVVAVTAAVAVFGVGATIILARRELRRTTGMRLRD